MQATQEINDLLGTWKHEKHSINLSYLEAGYVRFDHSAGHSFYKTNSEALELVDMMRDKGWTR